MAGKAGSDATLHDAAWEGNVDLVRPHADLKSPELPQSSCQRVYAAIASQEAAATRQSRSSG